MTTTTTNYNLIKSQIGGRIDTWGQDVHDSYDIIDTQLFANAGAAATADAKAEARLEKSANLSDVANAATARANLGVPQTSAVLLKADNLTGLANTATARSNLGAPAAADVLLKANNLSDVANVATARANLGANSASNLTTGSLSLSLTEQITRISGFASVADTTVPTTTPLNNRVVIASENCYANGAQLNAVVASRDSNATNGMAAVIASDNCSAASSSGYPNAVIASLSCETSSRGAVILASADCTASGTLDAQHAIIACRHTEVAGYDRVAINSLYSTVDHQRATVISSRSVATGTDTEDTGITMGHGTATAPSTANRTMRLQAAFGNIDLAGQVNAGATFSDFAELFPNATGAEIAPGTLLTFDAAGDGVRPADDGEDVCGVVSHTAAMLAGDTPFCWAGRYEKDPWGRRIVEEVPAERASEDKGASEGKGASEAVTERRLKESPQWNPELPQVPRSERPAEWTPVGLLGQVHVRTGEAVSPGDRLKAIGGKGFKSVDRTGVKVMRVEKAFDGDHGIAYCLINVRV